MATKIVKPIDPLAGLPVATAKPAPQPKAAPAAGGNVVNLASAKKKRKLSGDDYKNARDFARSATGYNDTSPIWGKRMPVVLMEIEELLDLATKGLGSGNEVEQALLLNRELQKRLATNQLISAQS